MHIKLHAFSAFKSDYCLQTLYAFAHSSWSRYKAFHHSRLLIQKSRVSSYVYLRLFLPLRFHIVCIDTGRHLTQSILPWECTERQSKDCKAGSLHSYFSNSLRGYLNTDLLTELADKNILVQTHVNRRLHDRFNPPWLFQTTRQRTIRQPLFNVI